MPVRTCCVIWTRGVSLTFVAGHVNSACITAREPKPTTWRAVAAWLGDETRRPGLVHIDPFDQHARAPGGYSSLELAARVADSGTGLVYWYGYDEPGAHGRAHKQLAALTRAPLWCGEMTVTGANDSLADLDHSAALCTFGIILANVQEGTADACAALGNALSRAYADAVLPDGAPGDLAFTSSTSVEHGKRT